MTKRYVLARSVGPQAEAAGVRYFGVPFSQCEVPHPASVTPEPESRKGIQCLTNALRIIDAILSRSIARCDSPEWQHDHRFHILGGNPFKRRTSFQIVLE